MRDPSFDDPEEAPVSQGFGVQIQIFKDLQD